MPDPRIELMMASSPVYVCATAGALLEVAGSTAFPPDERDVKQSIAHNYAMPETKGVISAYQQSAETPIEQAMLVANLAGRLTVYRIIDSDAFGFLEQEEPELFDDAASASHSSLDVATNLLLPAYMCAKYDVRSADELTQIAEGLSFDDLAGMFANHDFIQLAYGYTKTGKVSYTPKPFANGEQGVVQPGKYYKVPQFMEAFERDYDAWPQIQIGDICTKLPDNSIVYSEQFSRLIHTAIATVNKVQAAGANMEAAGSIGCPITYKAAQTLTAAGIQELQTPQPPDVHKDAVVVSAFLKLVARQFRALHQEGLAVIEFDPFELCEDNTSGDK